MNTNSNRFDMMTGAQNKTKYSSDEGCLQLSCKRPKTKSNRQEDNDSVENRRIDDISNSYLNIIRSIGENPNREGLNKTPQRAAKAILHFTKGYEEDINGRIPVQASCKTCFYQILKQKY